jgi:hypothetical protein
MLQGERFITVFRSENQGVNGESFESKLSSSFPSVFVICVQLLWRFSRVFIDLCVIHVIDVVVELCVIHVILLMLLLNRAFEADFGSVW